MYPKKEMHSRVAAIVKASEPVPYMKGRIPKALREQVWITHMGEQFKSKCKVVWCHNHINVFDFQCGHNVPESKGGKTNIANLIPICSRCNVSMGNEYTIDEWNRKFAPPSKSFFSCFHSKSKVEGQQGRSSVLFRR